MMGVGGWESAPRAFSHVLAPGGNSSAQPGPRAQGKTVTKQQQSAHEQKNETKGKYRHGILMGQHRRGQMRGGGTQGAVARARPSPAWLGFGVLPVARAAPASPRPGTRNPHTNRNNPGLARCSLLITSRCKKKTQMNHSVVQTPTQRFTPRSRRSTYARCSAGPAKPARPPPPAASSARTAPGTGTELLSGGGMAHPGHSLRGKLRHEEVKANIPRRETLQALLPAVPRSCRSR